MLLTCPLPQPLGGVTRTPSLRLLPHFKCWLWLGEFHVVFVVVVVVICTPSLRALLTTESFLPPGLGAADDDDLHEWSNGRLWCTN